MEAKSDTVNRLARESLLLWAKAYKAALNAQARERNRVSGIAQLQRQMEITQILLKAKGSWPI